MILWDRLANYSGHAISTTAFGEANSQQCGELQAMNISTLFIGLRSGQHEQVGTPQWEQGRAGVDAR